MCEKCVSEGKMTQAELEKESVRGVELVSEILELLNGIREEQVVNVLLSCLINVSIDTGITPDSIIVALVKGFNIPVISLISPSEVKEIKH